MYIKKCTVFAVLLGLIQPAFADSAVPFSPYADLTVNTTWNSYYNDMEPQDLLKIHTDTGVQSFHLAFINDAGNCTPAWGGSSSYSVNTAWGNHLLSKLLDAKVNYSIALGGANGIDLSNQCTPSQLLAAYQQIITTYQPQGLDFDIENGSANVGKIMGALQQIQNQYPDLKISFTLGVLPEGFPSQQQDVIQQAQVAGLNFTVNIMAMDYGSPKSDMAQCAIDAATNVFSFLKKLYPQKSEQAIWQMLEVTPMIGVNDTQGEEFTLNNVDTLRQFAEQNQLGGLAMWSVARDNPCASQWASPTCSGNNLQSAPYEFIQHFLQIDK